MGNSIKIYGEYCSVMYQVDSRNALDFIWGKLGFFLADFLGLKIDLDYVN